MKKLERHTKCCNCEDIFYGTLEKCPTCFSVDTLMDIEIDVGIAENK